MKIEDNKRDGAEAIAAGAAAFGKQMRGEYTTYSEVGQIEIMRDIPSATAWPMARQDAIP